MPETASLTVSVHAGESYRWPMRGLRSIGELITPDVVVDRIGHGLALAERSGRTPTNVELTLRDVLEDVLWLAVLNLDDVDPSRWINAVVQQAGLGALRVSEDHLINAWCLRRTIGGLVDGKIAQPGFPATQSFPSDQLSRREMRADNPTTSALQLLVYRFSDMGSALDQAAGQLGSRYLQWSDSVLERVASAVREQIASSVVLECCPTSNIALTRIESLRAHPLISLILSGHRVSINSDDPIIFGTNIALEMQKVREVVDQESLRALAATSVSNCARASPQLRADDFKHLIEVINTLFA